MDNGVRSWRENQQSSGRVSVQAWSFNGQVTATVQLANDSSLVHATPHCPVVHGMACRACQSRTHTGRAQPHALRGLPPAGLPLPLRAAALGRCSSRRAAAGAGCYAGRGRSAAAHCTHSGRCVCCPRPRHVPPQCRAAAQQPAPAAAELATHAAGIQRHTSTHARARTQRTRVHTALTSLAVRVGSISASGSTSSSSSGSPNSA